MASFNKIPEGAVELQTGLFLYTYTKVINGEEYTFNQLFASNGYHFYDKNVFVYDEEGNDITEKNRQYMTHAYLGKYDSVDNYIVELIDLDENV